MSRYKYKTKSDSDLIVFMLDGERVNLAGGSVEQTLPSTKKRPPRTVTVRGITDEDVEKLLADPVKYGDWSDKFIDTKSGFTPKEAAGTVKKSPDAAVEKPKQEDDKPDKEDIKEKETEKEVSKENKKETKPEAKPAKKEPVKAKKETKKDK